MELTYPRFVHSEFMTHRLFSRNAASSRAIPIQKMIEAVKTDPAMPVWWGKNQSGMQAKEELSEQGTIRAKAMWLQARNNALDMVSHMDGIRLHKQIANRILEPWMWITVVVSATEWSNFFALRCHPDAQPEFQKIAFMARDLYEASTSTNVDYDRWHLPYITLEDWHTAMAYAMEYELDTYNIIKKMSVARCARVSYLRQNNVLDIEKDIELHDRLASSGHWSPFEHVATPIKPYAIMDGYASETREVWSGNFKGWNQYRKEFQNECL